MCQIHQVDEELARHAARLRTATRRAGEIAATDALVVAQAARSNQPNILTSDAGDIRSLAENCATEIAVTPT